MRLPTHEGSHYVEVTPSDVFRLGIAFGLQGTAVTRSNATAGTGAAKVRQID